MLNKYSKLIIAIVWIVFAFAACDQNSTIARPPFDGGENGTVRLSALEDCTGEPVTTLANSERNDALQATVQEGKVSFIHTGALHNCCLDSISLEMNAEGNQISVVEKEYSEAPCFCQCEYTVHGEILDLEPGDYTIQICTDMDSEEILCYVTVKIN